MVGVEDVIIRKKDRCVCYLKDDYIMTFFLLITHVVDIIRNLNHLQPQQDKAKGRRMLGEKRMERENDFRFIVNRGGLNRRD